MTLSNLTTEQLAEKANKLVRAKKYATKSAMEHLEAKRVHAAREHLNYACAKADELKELEAELIARYKANN